MCRAYRRKRCRLAAGTLQAMPTESRPLETGTDELLAELDSGVAVITLNRPESRNALSDRLSPALRQLLPKLATDPDVRSVLITGAGTAFCAGGDVKGMGASGGGNRPATSAARPSQPRTVEDAIEDLRVRQVTLTGALYELPMPTLAALPGAAAGAGLSIALACDLRIAAESAFITTGFANIGLAGDYGASFFLTQLVGTAKARELFYGAARVDAHTCQQLGIVNRVVPDVELRETAFEWARELAAGPTVAFRHMKANLDRALRSDLNTCLAHEAEGTVATARTEDHREAVRAFIEKRRPTFKGN
jgi:enoyl-CoA hydratase/carnithine racemase